MANPLTTAIRGKGILPMLSRARTITGRYGWTSGKMDRALSTFTGVLKEFGCAATLPTTADALRRSPASAHKCLEAGVELAVHGLTHVDYTQISPDQQVDDLRRASQIFDSLGIPHTGFRCPYLRWNAGTLCAVQESGFRYDSSQALAWETGIESNESYRLALEFYGALRAADRPSLPWLEGELVRIPYCLPDDEALVERLKLPGGSPEMSAIWLGMLDRIYAAGELFTLGLHPERTGSCREALRALLARARALSPAVWIARLDEIAAWHRALGQTAFTAQEEGAGCFHITVRAPEGAVLLARGVDIDPPGRPWSQGYAAAGGMEVTVRSERRPWIGLPPDRPEALERFLRHLGCLVEISAEPGLFSYYFPKPTFSPEDERPLLAALETRDAPLVRLGRWPNGAQAALAVTGDVDAFTLWDYGLRILRRG